MISVNDLYKNIQKVFDEQSPPEMIVYMTPEAKQVFEKKLLDIFANSTQQNTPDNYLKPFLKQSM